MRAMESVEEGGRRREEKKRRRERKEEKGEGSLTVYIIVTFESLTDLHNETLKGEEKREGGGRKEKKGEGGRGRRERREKDLSHCIHHNL